MPFLTEANLFASSFFQRRQGQRRVLITVAVLLVLSIVLIGRLAYLQIISYSDYAALSTSNRMQIIPVPPVRGLIYDRNGTLLATNKVVFGIGVNTSLVDSIDALVASLGKIITINSDDINRFKEAAAATYGAGKLVLKNDLGHDMIAKVAVDRYRLPGVSVIAGLHRYYPTGDLASHVVGRLSRIDSEDVKQIDLVRYRGTDFIGKYGAELAQEEALLGWPGHEQIETNAHGQKVRAISYDSPVAGKNTYLTLDLELQKLAYDAIGDNKGALVAIEPKTGQVLAMVSKPSFDANQFGRTSSAEKRIELLNAEDSPLLNRAIQGRYSPGSTIKPFLALAAHNAGLADKEYYCPGWYSLPNYSRKFRCWKPQGHGKVSLRQAVAESCDVYFYILARELGIDQMYYELSKFGFGQPTGIELSNEHAGILPSREWKLWNKNESWYEGETLITGIGQGAVVTTMMQLANAVSIIANKGLHVKPKIVLKTVDVNTGQETVFEPEFGETVDANPEYFDLVTDYMVDVVHGSHGTANRLKADLNYKMAGKTGTVQVIQKAQNEIWDPDKVKKKFHPHGIFIAFAPVENPEIAVAVIVENGGSGSAIAHIAKEVMDHHILKRTPEL